MLNKVTILVNGIPYEVFKEVSITKSMETASGGFSFITSIDNYSLFPIKVGAACAILIDNEQAINGYVEKISGSYDQNSHEINIMGRDRTCDLVDSSLNEKLEFKSPITLTQIIRIVLDDLNLQAIKIIDQVGAISPFSQSEVQGAEVGQNAFDFLEKLCRKRQVLLTTNGNGDIVLTNGSGISSQAALIMTRNGNESNIESASFEYDETQTFNKYVCKSQNQPNLFGEEASSQGKNSIATDHTVRNSRVKIFLSESSTETVFCTNRAKREANIRRGRAFQYNARVTGFRQQVDGTLWLPNKLVNVNDDFANIYDTLLIKSVKFSQTLSSGSITELEMVDKNTYTLDLEVLQNKKDKKKKGGFFGSEFTEEEPQKNDKGKL
jgi:prophage tail gpP-like protein